MTVGLIMLLMAIYAAQHGAYGIACLALLVVFLGSFRVVILLGFIRVLRGSR
jgi:hypothetical protein